jgi:hypothetical protein
MLWEVVRVPNSQFLRPVDARIASGDAWPGLSEGRMAGEINWAGVATLALAGLAAGCSKPNAVASAASTGPTSTPLAASAMALVSVPLIGCANDGQGGPQSPPSAPTKTVQLNSDLAPKLAYYVSANGPGVLAPRGWSCAGLYGSNGATLVVSPQPVSPTDLMNNSWSGATGDAIELRTASGDTSGRFQVAQAIMRVFPAHQAFAQSVINEGAESASQFPSGPYPADTLTNRGNEVVAFQTAPNAVGLGTDTNANSQMKPGSDPVQGVAMLTGATPDLLVVAVRLPSALLGMAPAIVQEIEQDNPAGAGPARAANPPSPDAAAGGEAQTLAVVQDFYSALGAADGARASGDVVPEKRSGNYAAAALSRFYGSMRQPVRLISATVAGDTVAVRYAYVFANGKTCDGTATVAVTDRNGQALISGIHTLNGC